MVKNGPDFTQVDVTRAVKGLEAAGVPIQQIRVEIVGCRLRVFDGGHQASHDEVVEAPPEVEPKISLVNRRRARKRV